MKFLLYSVSLITIVLSLIACESQEQKEERLAKQYCSSCHLFPEPKLLTKSIWEKSVLPEMAFRMGMNISKISSYPTEDLKEIMTTIPARPIITDKNWELIKNYYRRTAPDTLIAEAKEKPLPLKQFDIEKFYHNRIPFVTLIKVDTTTDRIFYGTRFNQLFQLTDNFIVKDSFLLKSPASQINIDHDQITLSQMGIMDPNDQPKGSMVSLSLKDRIVTSIIDSIKRPVDFQIADLNNDKQDDYVVCAFGNFTGALTAYESLGNHKFKSHNVSPLPGTRKVVVKDFNNDGKKDILALISQGDEQLTLFINQGNFMFDTKILLHFPPVYGSSYFDIADFNNDGNFDILYTNGDNSDYSTILKPYHGVRIFFNDGKQKFSESWFYPMNGASQALARDFDGDGDIDIAAISFFPDFKNNPEEAFIYFENTGKTFKPQKTPAAQWGRWLVMEAADIDKDGDSDLLLGALTFSPPKKEIMQTWLNAKTSILILRNNQVK